MDEDTQPIVSKTQNLQTCTLARASLQIRFDQVKARGTDPAQILEVNLLIMHQFKPVMKAKVETGIVERNKWCSHGHEMLRDDRGHVTGKVCTLPDVLFLAYLSSNVLDQKKIN